MSSRSSPEIDSQTQVFSKGFELDPEKHFADVNGPIMHVAKCRNLPMEARPADRTANYFGSPAVLSA